MNSKQYFEDIAKNWDNMRESFFSVNIRNKAILLANIKPGSYVADIGAGSGFITEGLISLPIHVVAIDQSEEMLHQMRTKFKNFSNIEYKAGESEKIPMNDNAVDVVFCNMYLHHVENPQKAINELYRILKPRGKVIITDIDKHHYEFLVKEHFDRWMGFERTDIQRWYEKAGFKEITIDCIGDNCCAQSKEGNEVAKINIFVAIGHK